MRVGPRARAVTEATKRFVEACARGDVAAIRTLAVERGRAISAFLAAPDADPEAYAALLADGARALEALLHIRDAVERQLVASLARATCTDLEEAGGTTTTEPSDDESGHDDG